MSHKHVSNPARGFSMVEALVAILVTSIILVGTLTALDSTRRVTRNGIAIAEAQQTADFALQSLTNNLRKAGAGIGRTHAIARTITGVSGNTGATYIATWHNIDSATANGATGIWRSGFVNGGKEFHPVPGTDGITVRFTDGAPGAHLCGSNSGGGLATWLPHYPWYPAGYPVDGAVYEINLTPPKDCGGLDTITVLVKAFNTQTNCGPPPQQAICANNDPVCFRFYQNPTGTCDHFGLDIFPTGCAMTFCELAPLSFTTSQPLSYWISTEDGTGTIYSAAGVLRSRPVLISMLGLQGRPRIEASDVEDMQVTYLFDSTQPSAGVAPVSGQMAQLPTTTNNSLPPAATWRSQTAAVRALQIGLVARTPATDLIYKNNTYCTTNLRPSLRPLLSRPANGTRPAAVAADFDYCDGMRRQIVRQTIFLTNMLSQPL